MQTTSRTPPSAEVAQLIREGIMASRSGDKARCHGIFRHVTSLDPDNDAAWLWFAHTAADPRDAVAGLQAALRLNPANAAARSALPVALLQAGVAAARSNDRAAAATYLAEATATAPDNPTGWLWRAGVTDKPELAVEYLERVLQLNPDNAQAKQGLAKLRAQLAPQRACPICEQKVAWDDTVTEACLRCRAVVDLNRPELFDQAVPDLDRALVKQAVQRLKERWDAQPAGETAFALGMAYLNLGYGDEGVTALQIALGSGVPKPSWRDDIPRLIRHRQARAKAPPAQAGPNASSARVSRPNIPTLGLPRVMVVDDSPTVRLMVSSLLVKAGYRVTEASDAAQAADLVHELGAPRLFILDINMPGTDGFALCNLLRSHQETAKVPVVFLTGKTGFLSKIHGRWIGASEYLTKPFEPEKLIATVTRLVPKTAAARQPAPVPT
ncbi:MAG: response regulator [Gemmataceae bacterium]